MKKTFSLLLMILLCLSFIACAASPALTDPAADDAVPSSSATQPTETPSPVQFPLKEEFTIHINYDMPPPEGVDMQKALEANTLYQELYRLTNVKVQINFFGRRNDLDSMIRPSPPPGIMISNNSIQSWISNDGLLPLDSYIDNPALMPNLHQQVFANLPELRGTWAHEDGHIYTLGGYDSDPTVTVENYLWINKTWLDRANIEVPTTFEALETALTYFAEHDMNENAVKDDEIPFFVRNYSEELDSLMGMWGVPMGASSVPSGGNFLRLMYIDNGTVQFANNDQVKQFITTMKRWYDDGILYKGIDGFDTPTTDAILSDTQAGAVLAGAFLAPNLDGIRGREEYVCILPPAADGNSVRWFQKSNALGTPAKLCLAANCENPEIIMAWLDRFYALDTTIRYCYGEESSIGRVTNADGTFSPSQSDDAAKEEAMYTKQNLLIDILPHLPYAKTQDFYDKYQRTEEEKEQLQNWNLYKDILNPEPMPYMAYSEDDINKFREVDADIYALYYQKRDLAITGPGDLESAWENYQDALRDMTINNYLSIVQKRYDAWLAEKAG